MKILQIWPLSRGFVTDYKKWQQNVHQNFCSLRLPVDILVDVTIWCYMWNITFYLFGIWLLNNCIILGRPGTRLARLWGQSYILDGQIYNHISIHASFLHLKKKSLFKRQYKYYLSYKSNKTMKSSIAECNLVLYYAYGLQVNLVHSL